MSRRLGLWGDLHVGRLKKLVGEEAGLNFQRKLLSRLLHRAQEDDTRSVVILGDLFNTPFPSQSDMALVIDFLSTGMARNMEWLILMGNHDIYDAVTNSLQLLRRLPRAGALTNVRFITRPTKANIGGIKVLALPYGGRPSGPIDAELVLFHDAVVGAHYNGIKVGIGDIAIHPSKFDGIMAVGGHLHVEQRVGNVYFPGTAAQLSVAEPLPKVTAYLEYKDNRLVYYSREFDPPWKMESATWNDDSPPSCDASDTFYTLKVGDQRPGPRWLTDHPQVVSVRGVASKVQAQATNKIGELMTSYKGSRDGEREALKRWLRKFTPLDPLSRAKALRLHDQMSGSTRD